MKLEMEIKKVPKDEQRMHVSFLSEETRKKLNVDIGSRIHLIGKRRDLLLEVESDKECQDDFIYINHRIRSELGNDPGDSITIEKVGILTNIKFSVKQHIAGYIISFINWAWAIFSQ